MFAKRHVHVYNHVDINFNNLQYIYICMYIRDIYQQTSCQQLFQSIEVVMWFIGFLRGGNGKASCPRIGRRTLAKLTWMISAKGQWHLGSKPYQNQGSKPSNVLFSFFSASKHHHSRQPLLLFTWYGLIRSSPRCLERLLQLSGGEKKWAVGLWPRDFQHSLVWSSER